MASDSPITTALPTPPAPVTSALVPKPPPSPDRLRAQLAGLDYILLALVAVLAFLLAAFPATNSDLLQNLAVGRLVTQGKYQFGVDPFTFTTEGVYWANHSWLFGLIAYGVYSISSIGGVLLVVTKASLTVLLAVVMLRSSWRRGERWWLSATIVGIALLALSPRLLLQPAALSCLFLALTLWFLIRPAAQKPAVPETAERRRKARPNGVPISLGAYWPLPVLCLLWVNLDQWFFLGPVTVALYLIGVALQEKLLPMAHEAADPVEQPKTLGIVLLACVAACFVSPHHVHAFVLPPQLGSSPAAEAAHGESMFRGMFMSPLSTESNSKFTYYSEFAGLNVAGLMYFPLLLVGVASFLLTIRQMRLWRLTVWLPFAVLSLYHARAIPFFAVVAAPIAALNFLDFAAFRLGASYLDGQQARSWAISGRVLTVFLTLVTIGATIPGYTQAKPFESRHFGFGLQLDASMERAALQVAAWRQEGKLPADVRWFNTSPEVVNYFAWYCPGEKGFFDQRLTPFDAVAADFFRVRKALLPGDNDLAPAIEVFEKYRIGFVASYESDMNLQRPLVLVRLLSNSKKWPCVYGMGKAALFRRLERGVQPEADPYRALVVDDTRAAFGTAPLPAPRQRPAREPQRREFYEHLWTMPPHPFNVDADDSLFHYLVFDIETQTWLKRASDEMDAIIAGRVVGLAVPGTTQPFLAALAGQLMFPQLKRGDQPRPMQDLAKDLRSLYINQPGNLDAGPPASLYLAIRAARRALQANPDDARTHLLLGKLYLLLHKRTREGRLSTPELNDIRTHQILAALQQAVRLEPDLFEAHTILAEEYKELDYRDLRLHHMREMLRCVQETPESIGKPGEYRDKVLRELDQEVQKLDAAVRLLQDQFSNAHEKRSPLDRGRIAAAPRDRGGFGLAETAIKALQEINFEELQLKDPGAAQVAGQLLTNLNFLTGQTAEIRDLVKPETRADLGMHRFLPAISWYRVRLAAVSGDYQAADDELKGLLANAAAPARLAVANSLGDMIAQCAPRGLGACDPWMQLFDLKGLWPYRLDQLHRAYFTNLGHEADLRVLRAWLALEAGDNRAARAQLDRVLTDSWPPEFVLPLVAPFGASSPLEFMSSLNSSSFLASFPRYGFTGRGLALMGLRWLNGME